MKKLKLTLVMLATLMLAPSLSYAKGIPMFFNTGDEIFEIEGAPQYEEGYSLGYACKRFGLFGADIWTWDCKMMAVNLNLFSVADIDESDLTEFSAKYSLSDRKRNLWNHYGIALLLVVIVAFGLLKRRA
ncbi:MULTISPECIES: hypothetical protein [unclassified Hahella]|uniref:hypothetical protein n=1 Tax=unclassified Hahella TaxID=2624107 RepID=UPI000FDCF66B|nr:MULTISPECIES: hypothetical protein [unclassified Hahella]AZZ94265.1 hypothetical protein ENC22_24920 [Hahella sp. KA22]MBU6953085.1 hypothetical protein [Hahella sp. HN01]MDG9669926.1 hypothetical protein [Hahella sp. CR1]QAY57639.1 hypothetical protein EUZ85_27505 [Hahella sp. KA22]